MGLIHQHVDKKKSLEWYKKASVYKEDKGRSLKFMKIFLEKWKLYLKFLAVLLICNEITGGFHLGNNSRKSTCKSVLPFLLENLKLT